MEGAWVMIRIRNEPRIAKLIVLGSCLLDTMDRQYQKLN
jgi:hypothetical protein